jgi:hypothetical protein
MHATTQTGGEVERGGEASSSGKPDTDGQRDHERPDARAKRFHRSHVAAELRAVVDGLQTIASYADEFLERPGAAATGLPYHAARALESHLATVSKRAESLLEEIDA